MKQLRLFLLLAAGLFLTSCSEPQPDEFPNPDPPPTVGRHAVPIDQALGELDDLLGVIDGQGTRAGGVRTIAQVQTLHAQALALTRSAGEPGEQPENLLYVVNFEEDAGYAVLGADDRLPAVLAVTDEGSLTTEELVRAANGQTAPEEFTFPNEMLMNYVSGIGGIGGIGGGGIGGGIGGGGGIPTGPFTDFDKQLGNPDPFYDHSEWTDWETNQYVQPLLKTQWNQDNPYNIFCPETGKYNMNGGGTMTVVNCWAGCVAIACAQIIAYHSDVKAPSMLGNNVIEWDQIKIAMQRPRLDSVYNVSNIPRPVGAVAWMIRGIGDAVAMKYGENGSSSNIRNAEKLFRWLEYKDVYARNYDPTGVRIALLNKMPVYIRGADCNDGHAWVLDGLHSQYRHYIAVDIFGGTRVIETEIRDFVHCNFGWGSWYDGFYHSGIFNIYQRPSLQSTSPGDYTSLKIITYSSPI